MAQQPVLTASTTANERDQVVREVLGVTYANASSAQQAVIDKEGNAVFFQVTEWGKWYSEVAPDVTDLPTQWNEAFRAIWVANLKRFFRSPQDYHAHWTMYVVPLLSRIAEHYTADWMSTTVLADDTVTPESIRKSVIAKCIRQRTPVFPNIREIDVMIREEFVKLWNHRKWEFRKRSVQLTITATGDVQAAQSFIFDGMASKSFVIRDSQNGNSKIHWIDAERQATKAAQYFGTTGKPLFFYDLDEGDTKKIQFLPMPDQEYTAFAVIYIGAPDFAGAQATDGIKNLPVEFRCNLRDTVFGKALSSWGREDVDANRAMSYAQSERERLAAEWDDKGSSRSTARGHSQFRWVQQRMSSDGSSIVGQMG